MIVGKVIHGEGIGKKLGFATANLDLDVSDLEIAEGVYAAKANHGGNVYNAALIILAKSNKVEVFLFDYTGQDIYGEKLQVEYLEKVSEIEIFEKKEDLVEKIKKDINLVKSFFN